MVFSTFSFILAFLPVVLAGYYLLGRAENPIWQKLFLIIASLFFYGFGSWSALPLLLLSLAANWALALLIRRGGRLWLPLGLAFNIVMLGYCKYLNFFIENINLISGAGLSLQSIALPLGISFYSFQQIAWLLAVSSGRLGRLQPLDYLMYICFFPKLVMGPLAEPEQLIPQFSQPERRRFDAENFASGLFLFSMGLFKKVVVADSLALFVSNGFAMAQPGLAAAWLSSLSYVLQLYFDFSGYSDMALAVARMMNIELPFNFLSPLRAESISEFWRRWHITLGSMLSRWIYRPLGGSRRGLVRTCLNLIVTFLVSGLWHGAAWTFILWGLLNGLLAALERVFSSTLRRLPHGLRVAATFVTGNILWVLFRAESFSQALTLYRGMLGLNGLAFSQLAALAFDGVINFPAVIDYAYVLGAVALGLLVVFRSRNSAWHLSAFRPDRGRLLATLLMFCLSLLCLGRESVFIYFNF